MQPTTLRQQFLSHVAQTSDAPLMLEIASANGNYLFDIQGKKYLDLISGISVSSLGHGNTAIANAIQNQVSKHLHTMVYGELILEPQVKLAEALAKMLPPTLNCCYWVNSGTEAVEGAMKLAKRVTGRTGFVAMKKAYHGSTQGALSLMSEEYYSAAYRPLLPDINYIEQNNIAELDRITNKTTAVFVEPVMGEKGAVPCSSAFLDALRKRCNETGALLIFDEIQTGMGRTGKYFAFEHYGIVPDVLLLGKALGAGMPLATFISSAENMHALSVNPVLGHITTFGGHPVSCAAALAGLEVLTDNYASFEVEKKSQIFKRELSVIGDVNGLGLLLSLDLKSADKCKKVIEKLLDKGIFSDWFLYAPHLLRIAPPLTITEEEILFAIQAIGDCV